MRTGNNLKLGGGGLHHIAIQAADFNKSLHFYTEGLGFQPILQFPEGDRTVALLDTGDGTYLELFSGGKGEPSSGVLFHWALRTDDCDAAVERARRAGATVTEDPTDTVLEGDPLVPARYAFIAGPDGEQIELLQSEQI